MRVVAADCDVNTSGEDAKALLAFCSTPLEKRHSRDDRKNQNNSSLQRKRLNLKTLNPCLNTSKV